MADFNAQQLVAASGLAGSAAEPQPSTAQGLWVAEPTVTYFRMRGIDTTCPAIQQPAYVYWTVQDAPDWTAAQLTPAELPCGSDPLTDVVDIVLVADWTD